MGLDRFSPLNGHDRDCSGDETDPWVDVEWVCKELGIKRNTLLGDGTPERLGLVAEEDFPKPFRRTPRGKWYWWRSEILRYKREQSKKYPWTPPAANDNTPISEVEQPVERSPEAPPDDEGDIE